MNRKIVCALAATSMLLLGGAAFGAELQEYPGPEKGPIVVLVTNTACNADCAAITSKVEDVAGKHAEVGFRKATGEDVSTMCLSVTAGEGTIVSMTCDLANSDKLSAFIETQVEFAKRAQPLVEQWDDARGKLEAAQKPFREEAAKVRAAEEAELAPIQQKFEAALAPIGRARRELSSRIREAVNAELGFDSRTIKWAELTDEKRAELREKISKAQAPFRQEEGALVQKQMDTLLPIGAEMDKVHDAYAVKYRDIERRMIEATTAESSAARDAMGRLTAAITANQRQTPTAG
jgi:hypothetical protein